VAWRAREGFGPHQGRIGGRSPVPSGAGGIAGAAVVAVPAAAVLVGDVAQPQHGSGLSGTVPRLSMGPRASAPRCTGAASCRPGRRRRRTVRSAAACPGLILAPSSGRSGSSPSYQRCGVDDRAVGEGELVQVVAVPAGEGVIDRGWRAVRMSLNGGDQDPPGPGHRSPVCKPCTSSTVIARCVRPTGNLRDRCSRPTCSSCLPPVCGAASLPAILCLAGQVGQPICYRVTTGIPPVSAGAWLFRSCCSSVAVAIAGCTHDNRRVTPGLFGDHADQARRFHCAASHSRSVWSLVRASCSREKSASVLFRTSV